MYLYYELVQVSVIGNVHSMKLIVNVPLKTANSQFTLYKVVALPTRVSKTSFVKYIVDYSYFGLESSRHDYILLNFLTPNVNYSGRTAPLTSKVAFYIFIQQI